MQVAELSRVGLKAVTLDADTIGAARTANTVSQLWRDVAACQYSVIIVSPERLNTREFHMHIADNETFRLNIVLYVIDEAHVVIPWGSSLFITHVLIAG